MIDLNVCTRMAMCVCVCVCVFGWLVCVLVISIA